MSGHSDHPLERLVFFSDAVFAIAITLLVIEIHVPHVPHGAVDARYWEELAALTPSFFGYFLSFAVIGAFWAAHHRAFTRAGQYAPGLLAPNLAMLCAIALMPFVTAFMSANIGERVPTLIYNGTLLITGIFNAIVIRRATSAPVVRIDVGADDVAALRIRSYSVIIAAAFATLFAFVVPALSQLALVTIPLWWRLHRHRAARSARVAAERA